MPSVTGSVWTDLLISALLGCLGGLGLDLLQERGLQLPSLDLASKDTNAAPEARRTYVNLGFFAPLLVGALAAALTYATNQPTDYLKLIAAAIIAGLGGSGVLKAYMKDKAASQAAGQAEASQNLADAAVNVTPSSPEAAVIATQIDQQKSATAKTRARYGVR